MKILVTGAKGMIGSHLVTALLAEGYEVVGVDRAGEDSRSKMLSFFKADLADREGLCRIMDENGVDRVIHLAALAHTDGEPDLSWERYYHINVECAKNVFEAAGDRPVLFISTIDVYGFFDGKKPVTGKTRIHPVSNYAKSKALAEKECRKLSHYSIYRLSPVYTDEVKRDIQKRYYLT
ncbi:MAG: NAD(P)-dependent oxidoreductase [Lachnospiraceae bacterium]|nr:NAD(P)-dependent oxidoreductase [Lachnospiraceae bacterium]